MAAPKAEAAQLETDTASGYPRGAMSLPHESDGFELQVGNTLGAYRLEAVLGEGAMGLVFRAARDSDGETVALKVLKKKLSGDQTYEQRFRREARVAREVQHKHLVPILEAGEAEGRHFLAMEYVRGGSLEDRLQAGGPLPLEDTVRLAAEVGAGLDALHRHGLVHRDVKPSNIMLDQEGRAALTDFGLAKGPAYTVLTEPGMVMGTIDYLAPELIRGAAAAAASDIYALGCVVYECIAGSPPFASENMFEAVTAHLEKEPPDPCVRRDDVPPELTPVVLLALEKEPRERPPTARAYAQMLRVDSEESSS